MMVKGRTSKVLAWVISSPFRAIEMMVAPVFLVYGAFLLFFDEGTAAESPLYSVATDPQLTVIAHGVAYLLVGAAVFITAYRGNPEERRTAVLLLFLTMLYSLLLRVMELGFSISSLIFIWAGLVTALVDVIHTSGSKGD